MDEYIKIAECVARTFQKVYHHHSDDILSVAYLEAVRCHKIGLMKPKAVRSIRSRVVRYLNKFSKPLPEDNKPEYKEDLKMYTTVTPRELEMIQDFAFSGNKRMPPELREAIDKFKLETCFLT